MNKSPLKKRYTFSSKTKLTPHKKNLTHTNTQKCATSIISFFSRRKKMANLKLTTKS